MPELDENKSRRRLLSFGIRDLLWAMVVVGLCLGWSLDHKDLRQRLGHATYTAEERAMHQEQLKLARKTQDHLERQVKGLGDYARQEHAKAKEFHARLKRCQAESAGE